MLKSIDLMGVIGIGCMVVGLVLFILGRGTPAHPHIWRDWLLAFVLVIVGGVLAIAWPLIRLVGTTEEEGETKPKAITKAAGERTGA